MKAIFDLWILYGSRISESIYCFYFNIIIFTLLLPVKCIYFKAHTFTMGSKLFLCVWNQTFVLVNMELNQLPSSTPH